MKRLVCVCLSTLLLASAASAAELWCGPLTRRTNLGATATSPNYMQVAEIWMTFKKQGLNGSVTCTQFTNPTDGLQYKKCNVNPNDYTTFGPENGAVNGTFRTVALQRWVNGVSQWVHYATKSGSTNRWYFNDVPFSTGLLYGQGYIGTSGSASNNVMYSPPSSTCP